MTAFDYARTKAAADRLLERFGQASTLKRPGTASGDAWNPTLGADTSEAVTVVVDRYRAAEIDGTRILATDLKALVARGDLAASPAIGDTLTIGGVDYRIVDVRPATPGGTVLYYEVQARR